MESSSTPSSSRCSENPESWPEFAALSRVVRTLLSKLPSSILYHDIDHTMRDVFPTAVDLALREGLSRREAVLVGAAALFHDVGYLERYHDNEPIGARYARELLPEYGFSQDEIAAIEAMILATQVPQRPSSVSERVVCDADLAHLSTDRCFLVGERLRLERVYHGEHLDLKSWFEANVRFMESHRYHTATAREHWQPGKESNLRQARHVLGGA